MRHGDPETAAPPGSTRCYRAISAAPRGEDRAIAEFNADDVDMLTLVMVGSSQSKSMKRGDGRTCAYTPRGYAKKREQP
jgi:precorrin-3B methylase